MKVTVAMKQKTMVKLFAAVVLAVVFLMPGFRAFAAEGSTVTVQVKGTYDQTGARSMLGMINDFRKNEGTQNGDQAWWMDQSGNRVARNGLSDLQYDYALEERAMQRAAELAVSFSHTRPDGTSSLNASAGFNGENIAAGQTSVEAAFTSWLEAEDDFNGQGHRRNMLGGYNKNTGTWINFTTVGIAHFVYEGYDFWVQEFGTRTLIAPIPAHAIRRCPFRLMFWKEA